MWRKLQESVRHIIRTGRDQPDFLEVVNDIAKDLGWAEPQSPDERQDVLEELSCLQCVNCLGKPVKMMRWFRRTYLRRKVTQVT